MSATSQFAPSLFAPITALYAALGALLLVVLTIRVIKLRQRLRIGIGTGDKPELARAIRVHGNFIESAPMALIVMALAESMGVAGSLIHAAGMIFISSRVMHAIALSRTTHYSLGRFLGMAGTFTVQVSMALAILWIWIKF